MGDFKEGNCNILIEHNYEFSNLLEMYRSDSIMGNYIIEKADIFLDRIPSQDLTNKNKQSIIYNFPNRDSQCFDNEYQIKLSQITKQPSAYVDQFASNVRDQKENSYIFQYQSDFLFQDEQLFSNIQINNKTNQQNQIYQLDADSFKKMLSSQQACNQIQSNNCQQNEQEFQKENNLINSQNLIYSNYQNLEQEQIFQQNFSDEKYLSGIYQPEFYQNSNNTVNNNDCKQELKFNTQLDLMKNQKIKSYPSTKDQTQHCSSRKSSFQQDENKRQIKQSLKANSKKCKCKNSKCLKMYCECFQFGNFCSPECGCSSCCNTEQNLDLIQLAQEDILVRNPRAFHSKLVEKSNVKQTIHRDGCNCKNSQCQKNYCECFQMGVDCTSNCKCKGCKNCDIKEQQRRDRKLKKRKCPFQVNRY